MAGRWSGCPITWADPLPVLVRLSYTALMPWFRTLSTLACLCMASLLASAPAFAQAERTVRVGIGLTKPPYFLESGKEGLDYEIAEQAFAASGYKMLPLQLPPSRGLAMQRAGQLDALLSVDEGIGGSDFFSDTYITYQNFAITLSSRNLPIRRIEDLTGYSVAAFQNARLLLGERFKALTDRHTDYKEYSQQVVQDNLLYTGHVDVVVGDRRIFTYFSTRLDPKIDAAQPVTFHAIFPPSPRKAVFRDAELRARFNAGLKSIQGNGVYDAIQKKYASYLSP